jgi:hypothetical protein
MTPIPDDAILVGSCWVFIPGGYGFYTVHDVNPTYPDEYLGPFVWRSPVSGPGAERVAHNVAGLRHLERLGIIRRAVAI